LGKFIRGVKPLAKSQPFGVPSGEVPDLHQAERKNEEGQRMARKKLPLPSSPIKGKNPDAKKKSVSSYEYLLGKGVNAIQRRVRA